MSEHDESSIAEYESPKSQGQERRERADAALDDYAAGFRSATKRVHLRPNLHLMADLEALLDEAEALDEDDPRLDDIEAEFEAIKEQFEAERAITLRAISTDVVRAVERQAKADGLDPQALANRLAALQKPKRIDVEAVEDLKDEARECGLRITCRQVAAMVVDDDEVDAEWIYNLSRTAEHEYLALIEAVNELQKEPGRVAPDFSRARSATRRAG